LLNHREILLLYGLCLSCICPVAGAEQPADSLCPPDYELKLAKPEQAKSTDSATHVDANSAVIDGESMTRFSGDVVVRQDDKQLKADEVNYDRSKDQVEASGNITFTAGEMQLKGKRAVMNLRDSRGQIENADYQTGTVNGRGKAKIIRVEGPHALSLDDASYTTCPRDHVAWQLRADKIDLDNQTHQGTARNMVLHVGHVPVLYLPYIRFPIGEERLSGFLYPAITVSQSNGTEFSIPYYWNIAPNMDATITVDNMSKRGVMLQNEFRYLTENSKGNIELDHMGMDTLYGDSRTKFDWNHSGKANTGWSSLVDYHYVSDTQYLSDFTNTLTAFGTSTTALNRQGTLSYNRPNYQFIATLQDYQTIATTEQYKRLPQLGLSTRLRDVNNHWNYNLNAELVNFDIDTADKVTGQRVRFSPYLSYPLVGNAGYFKPRLSLNYLDYQLKLPAGSTASNSPGVSVPIFSLDTGIYLDREGSIGGTKILQTLEPRLFYLYAPYRDQSGLPIFDTTLSTFSPTLLFSENRFSGNDRIGDANQVTAALTTRIYRQDNGAQLLDATVGEIFYFRDREVVLPGQTVDTRTRSNYLASLVLTPNPDWSLNGDIQYDPESGHTQVGNVRLQNHPGPGRVINLEYRFTRDELRTQGATMAWRINPRWQFYAGSIYDLRNDHRLQNFTGLGYDSCCWGLRLVWGERFDTLVNNTPRYEHAIYLEFVLKGLSSVGSGKDIDTLLKNGILGYSQ